MSETLGVALRPLIRDASVMRLSPAENLPVTASKFGGIPYSRRREAWPDCTNCGRCLAFVCQVDLGETALRIQNVDFFTFFYCWECFPLGHDGEAPGRWAVRTYVSPTKHNAKILRIPKDVEQASPCRTSFEATRSLPHWDDTPRWCPRALDLAQALNRNEPWEAYREAAERLVGAEVNQGSQVGGYPSWIHGQSTPNGMELLAQIASEEQANVWWGDAGCVFLFVSTDDPRKVKLVMETH